MFTNRSALTPTRCLFTAVALGAVGCVWFAYTHADLLDDSQTDVLTLLPAAVLGMAACAHVRQRFHARRAGLVRGRLWIDIVACVVLATGGGIGVSVIGYNQGGAEGDLLFNAGMSLWLVALIASPLGYVLGYSFVDAPRYIARTISKRAGWYLVVVMAAVYLFAIAMAVSENFDNPPLPLGLPGAVTYAVVMAVGVVLIVEQAKARDRDAE